MNREHHVVPNSQGGWDIKQSNHSTKLHFNTKKEAVDKARQLSIEAHTELVIHDARGRIKTKDSHGHDSRTSKG